MAKRKVNKSEMVREVIGENPSLSVNQVREVLKGKGIEVSYQAAYTAMKKAGSNGTTTTRVEPKMARTMAKALGGKEQVALEQFAATMDKVYDLIDRLGAKQLASIVDRIAAREEGSIARQELHG